MRNMNQDEESAIGNQENSTLEKNQINTVKFGVVAENSRLDREKENRQLIEAVETLTGLSDIEILSEKISQILEVGNDCQRLITNLVQFFTDYWKNSPVSTDPEGRRQAILCIKDILLKQAVINHLGRKVVRFLCYFVCKNPLDNEGKEHPERFNNVRMESVRLLGALINTFQITMPENLVSLILEALANVFQYDIDDFNRACAGQILSDRLNPSIIEAKVTSLSIEANPEIQRQTIRALSENIGKVSPEDKRKIVAVLVERLHTDLNSINQEQTALNLGKINVIQEENQFMIVEALGAKLKVRQEEKEVKQEEEFVLVAAAKSLGNIAQTHISSESLRQKITRIICQLIQILYNRDKIISEREQSTLSEYIDARLSIYKKPAYKESTLKKNVLELIGIWDKQKSSSDWKSRQKAAEAVKELVKFKIPSFLYDSTQIIRMVKRSRK